MRIGVGWFLFVIVLFFCLPVTLAQVPAEDTKVDWSSANLQNVPSDQLQKAIESGDLSPDRYSDSNLDWSNVDQSKVPVDNINKIPPDKIKVDQINDKTKLTKDQLLNKDNLAKLGDLSTADSPALRDALKDKGVNFPAVSFGTGTIVEQDVDGRIKHLSGSLQRQTVSLAYTKF